MLHIVSLAGDSQTLLDVHIIADNIKKGVVVVIVTQSGSQLGAESVF